MDGQSNGNIVGLLERIAAGVEGTNERLDQTNERLDQTNERLGRLEMRVHRIDDTMQRGFADVNARLDVTNARIDNVLRVAGSGHHDHEERIQVLEEIVIKKQKA